MVVDHSWRVAFLLVPPVLHGGEQDHLHEGDQLAEDQPDVQHLDHRGGRQPLHLAHEDRGHHQHGGQVHT